jgi:hypothetical protein
LLKRFRDLERERSDGSWDYGLTFIFPSPPLIAVKRPARLGVDSYLNCRQHAEPPNTDVCTHPSSELGLKIL